MSDFEEDYFAKHNPKPPQDVNSHALTWTLSELVAVCLSPSRPPSLEDPRTAFIELAERLDRQLGIEHEMQAPENRESAKFRRGSFVGNAFSKLEIEIRVAHGRLRLALSEIETSIEPLNKAIQRMRVFPLRPAPLPGDLRLALLNLADDQVITQAQFAADKRVTEYDHDEMALGNFDSEILRPALSTFAKYGLHCDGVLQDIRSVGGQATDGLPLADGPIEGKWVWWNGKKFKVESSQAWNLINFFWKRNSARFDELVDGAGKIWEDPVTDGTISVALSRASLEASKIGLTWKLSINTRTRYVSKVEK